MIVRGIDGTGDWIFGKGKNDYKSEKNAVAQLIVTKLNSFIGDCFFALDEGIDWFNFMGNKKALEMKLAVSAKILSIPEVTKIIEINISRDSKRKVTIQYEVDTIYGSLPSTVFTQEV